MHFGDFVWLENGSNFELLEDTAVHRIYQVNTEMVLQESFRRPRPQSRKGYSVIQLKDCSHYSRTEHLEQNWAVWMVKVNPE